MNTKTPKPRTSLDDKIMAYRSSPDLKNELTLASKYIDVGTINSVISKIFEDTKIQAGERNVEMVAGIVYNKVVTEHAWDMAKQLSRWNEPFNYREFENVCMHKASTLFKEVMAF